MRTKTLLIAAAALAAAVTSSNAQTTVYSQNIVGYVNQTFVNPGGSYFIVAPLAGGTNTIESLMSSSLQSGDDVLIWNGNGYDIAYFVGAGNGNPVGQDWDDANFNPIASPTLKSAQGFFYQTASGAVETNTWTGTCVLSNSIAFNTPGGSYAVGSTPPVAGALDDPNTINLPLQSGDDVLVYNGNGYDIFYYVGPGNGNPVGQNWDDANFNPVVSPTVSVGQGFFYQTASGATETWTQNLNVQ